jgi:hypothetical protein
LKALNSREQQREKVLDVEVTLQYECRASRRLRTTPGFRSRGPGSIFPENYSSVLYARSTPPAPRPHFPVNAVYQTPETADSVSAESSSNPGVCLLRVG